MHLRLQKDGENSNLNFLAISINRPTSWGISIMLLSPWISSRPSSLSLPPMCHRTDIVFDAACGGCLGPMGQYCKKCFNRDEDFARFCQKAKNISDAYCVAPLCSKLRSTSWATKLGNSRHPQAMTVKSISRIASKIFLSDGEKFFHVPLHHP